MLTIIYFMMLPVTALIFSIDDLHERKTDTVTVSEIIGCFFWPVFICKFCYDVNVTIKGRNKRYGYKIHYYWDR